MVMVSARLTRRWRLSYRHDSTNADIRRLARRLVAARRAAVPLFLERERRTSHDAFAHLVFLLGADAVEAEIGERTK